MLLKACDRRARSTSSSRRSGRPCPRAVPTREARLDSAVALRNEDGAPHASFTAVVSGNGHLVLNASSSSDPENDPLTYSWSYDGTTIPSATDVTLDYQPTPFSGSHTV